MHDHRPQATAHPRQAHPPFVRIVCVVEPGPGTDVAIAQAIAVAGRDSRVLFVGGAGSLLTPDGTRLLDTDGFPTEYLAEATTGAAALELFRAAPDAVDWTFVSPAPGIAPGERTGSYATSLDTPAGDFITAEDYAVVLVDEIEEPRHRRQRFTAASA